MVTLDAVRGQERPIARLRRALDGQRVAHAYLFTGPAGSGKTTTALALAMAMNCLEAPGRGCSSCASCTRIADGIHPDVRVIEREGAARIIPIDKVRSEVLATIGMPPHEARARFFVIEEATAMQGPAANALLKTLEEPPLRTHFVLATTAPDKLLPTIRSRCQRIPFSALPADLRAQLHGDEDAGDRLSEMADKLLEAAHGRASALVLAAEAAAEKGAVGDLLDLLAARLHAAAVAAAQDGDLDSAALESARAQDVLVTHEAVQVHNAHGQLALEDLLYRLRERVP